MKSTAIEDGTLLKSTSKTTVQPTTVNSFKAKKARCGKRIPNSKTFYLSFSKQESKTYRFDLAFSKALQKRSAYLGRRLTRPEWIALKRAVRKQCFGSVDDSKTQISRLYTRLARTERLVPKSITAVAAQIELFHQQIQLLRQQAIELATERESLAPNCPHFRHRKVYRNVILTTPLYTTKPGFPGTISYHANQLTGVACCDKCLDLREEAFFSWTGDNLSVEDLLSQYDCTDKSNVLRQLKRYLPPPLAIQSVWSSILLQKFGTDYLPDS